MKDQTKKNHFKKYQSTRQDRFEHSPSLISFKDVKQHDPIIKQNKTLNQSQLTKTQNPFEIK